MSTKWTYLLTIIAALLLFGPALQAGGEQGTLAAGARYAVLTEDDSVSYSQHIWFTNPHLVNQFAGSVRIHGYVRTLSDTQLPVQIWARAIDRGVADSTDFGPWHKLGDVAASTGASDTSYYEFVVSRETWWGICDGLDVATRIVVTGTHTIQTKGVVKWR